MDSPLKNFKARALSRPEVRSAYIEMEDECAFIDEVLKARSGSGLTQAQVAQRMGTTQSAVARLESGTARHSPSISTLRRYAQALGCRLEVRFVKEGTARATSPRASIATVRTGARRVRA